MAKEHEMATSVVDQTKEDQTRAIEVIQTYDWLIFTSVNGVERFRMRLQRLSGSLSKLTGTQIAAIGPQTAARLAREGLKPAVVPKRYLAEGICMGASENRSPPVLMTRISTLASGQRCSILRFTQFAWAKDSTLPRVPIRIGGVARSIFRPDRKAS